MNSKFLYIVIMLQLTSQGYARVSEISLNASALGVNKIQSAVTVDVPRGFSWSEGVRGSFQPGYFNLTTTHDDESREYIPESLTLEVSLSPLLHVAAKTCIAGSNCGEVSTEIKGNIATFQFSGIQWNYISHGVPCLDGTKCKISFPSWSLSQLASKTKAMTSLPSMLTLVQSSSTLYLVNTETATSILEFKFANQDKLASLGKLLSADFNVQGELALTFNEGRLLLSFEHDKVLLVNLTGVYLMDGGIGSLGSVGFSLLFYPSSTIVNHSLAARDSLIAWDKGLLTYDFSKSDAGIQNDNFVSYPEEMVMSFVQYDENNKVWSFGSLSGDGKSLKIGQYKENAFTAFKSVSTSVPGSRLLMMGSYPYQLGPKGLYTYSSKNKKETTSLSGVLPSLEVNDDYGNIWVTTGDLNSSNCSKELYYRAWMSQQSFLNTGGVVSCSTQATVFHASRVSIVTTYSGTNISILANYQD